LACSNGTYSTQQDTTCSACTVCQAGYVYAPCTSTSDTQCLDPACPSNTIIIATATSVCLTKAVHGLIGSFCSSGSPFLLQPFAPVALSALYSPACYASLANYSAIQTMFEGTYCNNIGFTYNFYVCEPPSTLPPDCANNAIFTANATSVCLNQNYYEFVVNACNYDNNSPFPYLTGAVSGLALASLPSCWSNLENYAGIQNMFNSYITEQYCSGVAYSC